MNIDPKNRLEKNVPFDDWGIFGVHVGFSEKKQLPLDPKFSHRKMKVSNFHP